jgi:hypothetical protein
LGIFAVLMLLAAAVLHVYLSHMSINSLSKLSLSNVEALSAESGGYSYFCYDYCESNVWYDCWLTLSNGYTQWCYDQNLKSQYLR